jgi:hypothetical protein
MADNEECKTCTKENCSKECFNTHVGSVIALQKMFAELGVKGYIAGQEPILGEQE